MKKIIHFLLLTLVSFNFSGCGSSASRNRDGCFDDPFAENLSNLLEARSAFFVCSDFRSIFFKNSFGDIDFTATTVFLSRDNNVGALTVAGKNLDSEGLITTFQAKEALFSPKQNQLDLFVLTAEHPAGHLACDKALLDLKQLDLQCTGSVQTVFTPSRGHKPRR